jgi:cell division septal protein FtsQ
MFYVLATAALALIFLIFSVLVFFRVSRVEVTGNVRYSSEQILAAAAIGRGDNLLLIDMKSVAARVRDKLPYVAAVTAERVLPNAAVITITESRAIAEINYGGVFWRIDKAGRILEYSDMADYRLIRVVGVAVIEPKVGAALDTGAGDEARQTALEQLLLAMSDANIVDSVRSIDVTDLSRITFSYGGAITGILGSDRIAGDIIRFVGALSKIDSDYAGEVDMLNAEQVYVRPTAPTTPADS